MLTSILGISAKTEFLQVITTKLNCKVFSELNLVIWATSCFANQYMRLSVPIRCIIILSEKAFLYSSILLRCQPGSLQLFCLLMHLGVLVALYHVPPKTAARLVHPCPYAVPLLVLCCLHKEHNKPVTVLSTLS